MAQVLWCRKCRNWYAVQTTIPDICPHCEGSASWTTEEPKPYRLSENDRRFLRSIKIQPEV